MGVFQREDCLSSGDIADESGRLYSRLDKVALLIQTTNPAYQGACTEQPSQLPENAMLNAG